MKLFVYGSLMSRTELERVLGRSYDGEYRPHRLRGYRREWQVSDGEMAYLGLRKDAASSISGFLIELTGADLEKLDDWEPGYHRVLIENFEVYMSTVEQQTKTESFVLRSYLNMVQQVAPEPLPKVPPHMTIVEDD